jgi:hypothetical protein
MSFVYLVLSVSVASLSLQVLAALAQDGEAIRFASSSLRDDAAVVLAAVTQSGWALEFVPHRWQGDAAVVLAAVRQEGGSLACAAEALQANREVVLAAVAAPHEDPWREATALHFASPELRADKVLEQRNDAVFKLKLNLVELWGKKTAPLSEACVAAFSCVLLDVVLFVFRVCSFFLCQGVVLAALKGCPVQFESVSCLALRSDSEVVAAAGVQHDLGSFTY